MKRRSLKQGQRVLVLWDRHGWLPGTFSHYSTPDPKEDFKRCIVEMDNGFACWGSGYHPSCVKAA